MALLRFGEGQIPDFSKKSGILKGILNQSLGALAFVQLILYDICKFQQVGEAHLSSMLRSFFLMANDDY